MYYLINGVFVFVVALILFAASGVQAQEWESIGSCLPSEVTHTWVELPNDDADQYVIDTNSWNALADLNGFHDEKRFLSGGWNTIAGLGLTYRLYALDTDGNLMAMWLYWSSRNPHYLYWLVFNTLSPGEDGNPHPCGAFRSYSYFARPILQDMEAARLN